MPPKKTQTPNGRVQKRPVEEDLEELEAADKMDYEEPKPTDKKTNDSKTKSIDSCADIFKKLADDEPVPQDFFMCDVVELSERLIGTYLVRQLDDGRVIKSMIVETEAYQGPLDKACHAYNNKKTEKTKWFWQDGGHLYMYSIHASTCMNITSATKNDPEAVLIRALEPVEGVNIMKEFRKNPKLPESQLSNGPGKLCQSINIDKGYNGHFLCNKGKLYLTKGRDKSTIEIETSKRINIDYAQEWIDKLWRFTLKGNKYISKK